MKNKHTIDSTINIEFEKPVKYLVSVLEKGPDSLDLMNNYPLIFYFDQDKKTTDKKKNEYIFKLNHNLIDSNFENYVNIENKPLNDFVVKYGLWYIRNNPSKMESEISENNYNEFYARDKYSGEELKEAILLYINQINKFWPNLGVPISYISDFLGNSETEIREWTSNLFRFKMLEKSRNTTVLFRKKVTTNGYIINPSKKDEIDKLLINRKFNLEMESNESNPIKVFVSYISNNKTLAGRIKEKLESFGIEVFVAHDTINVTEEWRERILDELDSCDFFISVLTNKYRSSKWTDQEAGYAIALKKKIISLMVGELPHGFLEKFQATKINARNATPACKEIIEQMNNLPDFKYRLQKNLIDKFNSSDSFTEAFEYSKILLSLAPFEYTLLEMIKNGFDENNQIYRSGGAVKNLKELIKNHKSQLDSIQYKELIHELM